MELDELKQIWNEQARKLDHVLNLTWQGLRSAQLNRTRSALDRFKKFCLIEMLIGLAVLIWSGSYIAGHFSVLTLSLPALILAASALVVVIGDIRQLVLLGQIDYAGPVTTIQRKLEEMKLHFLRTIRLMILMFPLYMVYVVLGLNILFGWDILAHGDRAFLWANLVFSLILAVPAVWLFRKLSLRDIGHPFIHAFVRSSGGKQMLAALEFLGELKEFQDQER